MDIHAILHWFKEQNWFVLSFAIVGWLNCIVAGARVMGWNQLADFCGKLEDAIQAMYLAALNRKQQIQSTSKPIPPDTTIIKSIIVILCLSLCSCAGYRLSHVSGKISGTNINTGYGPADAILDYDATTCISSWGGKCPTVLNQYQYPQSNQINVANISG